MYYILESQDFKKSYRRLLQSDCVGVGYHLRTLLQCRHDREWIEGRAGLGLTVLGLASYKKPPYNVEYYMGPLFDGDYRIGKEGERTPKTIEEKVEHDVAGMAGTVKLALDAHQAELRAQFARENHGASLLAIDPTLAAQIMGGIDPRELASEVAIGAGKAEALKILSARASHIDSPPAEERTYYAKVLNAMVAALQGGASRSDSMNN